MLATARWTSDEMARSVWSLDLAILPLNVSPGGFRREGTASPAPRAVHRLRVRAIGAIGEPSRGPLGLREVMGALRSSRST
jgi:hypothetical protein